MDSFGPVYLSFSPRDVVFAGWVGDLDSSWDGLQQGLKRMRVSSDRKFVRATQQRQIVTFSGEGT